MSENFDKQYFLELLSSVENSQNSIKQVANYMFYHRETNHFLATSLWKDYFLSLTNNTSECYLLFYIIHEIIILSAKKNKLEFVSSVGESLYEIIVNLTFKSQDINCLIKVYEIIDIWESLMIYSGAFTKELKEIIVNKVRIEKNYIYIYFELIIYIFYYYSYTR